MPHNQPGRRFALGSNKTDQLLGAFGFISHSLLFVTIGGLIGFGQWLYFTGGLAIFCLGLRAAQVGLTTTKESLRAIREAWRQPSDIHRN